MAGDGDDVVSPRGAGALADSWDEQEVWPADEDAHAYVEENQPGLPFPGFQPFWSGDISYEAVSGEDSETAVAFGTLASLADEATGLGGQAIGGGLGPDLPLMEGLEDVLIGSEFRSDISASFVTLPRRDYFPALA